MSISMWSAVPIWSEKRESSFVTLPMSGISPRGIRPSWRAIVQAPSSPLTTPMVYSPAAIVRSPAITSPEMLRRGPRGLTNVPASTAATRSMLASVEL